MADITTTSGDLTEKYEKEAVYVVKSKFPLLGWAPKACKVVDSREVWAKLVDYWTYDLILESVVEKSGFSKFALTKKDSVIEWLNHLNELMNFNDKDAHRFLLLKVLYPFHPSIRPVNGVDN